MLKINRKQEGSILIEVLISVLLFAICIIGVLEFQAEMARSSYQAKFRNEATEFASRLVTKIMLDKNNVGNYVTGSGNYTPWDADVKKILPNATTDVSLVGNELTISILWISNDEAKEVGGIGNVVDADKHVYSVITTLNY